MGAVELEPARTPKIAMAARVSPASARVHQLGGTLSVDAAPGRGTTVTVDLSLTETP